MTDDQGDLTMDHLEGRSPADIERSAWDHTLFPLTPTAELRETGPRIWASGEGVRVTDIHGRIYLDMMSATTRANTLGYGNAEVADAVSAQLRTMHYGGTVSNLSIPTVELTATIAELAPGDLNRVVLTSGGSESVETALKLARQYQHASGNKPRAYKVISRWNAYHGATAGALSVTDWLGVRHPNEPGVPGVSFIPGPTSYRNPFGMEPEAYEEHCATYLEQQILHEGPDLVAAFIAEPIMQAHGVQIASPAYLQRVRDICTRHGVLWIDDEVITGFGRAGAWFAVERAGVAPDIMTMAKGISAGYMPLGACVTTDAVADALPVFAHVHTFSGHAAACAAANAVVAIKRRGALVQKASDNGDYLLDGLRELLEPMPLVGQVRGVGMWHAVDFTSDHRTKAPLGREHVQAIAHRAFAKGVIVSAIGDAVEIAPPLITSRADLDHTVRILADAIREITAERGLA